MRQRGDFEYGEDAEKAILSLVAAQPKTTADITCEAKKKFFDKIHFVTVKRMLVKMGEEGKVKWKDIGRMRLWSR